MVRYKTTANLHMRKGAGTSSPSIQTIPKGHKVNWYGYSFCGDDAEWKLVEYKGKMGFCSGKYLKEV